MDARICRLDPQRLDRTTTEALYDFHSGFVQRSRDSFEYGLRRSHELWLLAAGQRDVRGFAALEYVPVHHEGREHLAIYTRWAFVEETHRRQGFVQRVGVWAWLRARLRRPTRPVYWVFTASTLDSYLHMLKTSQSAYPNRRAPTPPHVEAILRRTHEVLGTEGWDAEAGVVRRSGEVRYLTGIAREEQDDPDASFYRARNPHQARGDSLGCIAVADLTNLSVYARRALRRARPS
ncbi:MAG: hypothetical protein JNL79_23560 [Myxococcales bacterium]|nr:hypothetical protein [Myxococcales bacterium]